MNLEPINDIRLIKNEFNELTARDAEQFEFYKILINDINKKNITIIQLSTIYKILQYRDIYTVDKTWKEEVNK